MSGTIPGRFLCLRGFPRMGFYGRLQKARPRKLPRHLQRRYAEQAKQRKRREEVEYMARMRQSGFLRGLKP